MGAVGLAPVAPAAGTVKTTVSAPGADGSGGGAATAVVHVWTASRPSMLPPVGVTVKVCGPLPSPV
jgi:hypothetical protein